MMRHVFVCLGVVWLSACAAGTGVDEELQEGSQAVDGATAAREEALRLPRLCGGARDRSCKKSEYCRGFGSDQCRSEGELGFCVTRPDACTRQYDPVCGCDGQTYGNACEAAASGVGVAAQGECEPAFGPFCGGIAGIACPGAGSCADDPRDDCDPEAGGADCGGVCSCDAIGLCVEGSHWDSSADVCACVPDQNPCAAVLCPTGTQCVASGDTAVCEPLVTDPCATVRCAAGTHCVATGGTAVCEPDAGAACGATTCGAGLVCCNASCGICTPPGGAYIQVACD